MANSEHFDLDEEEPACRLEERPVTYGFGEFDTLVGQPHAIAMAVRNVSGRERWSKLREWLAV